MGAEKPQLQKTNKKPQKSNSLLLVALAVLLLGIALFQFVNSKAGKTTPALSPQDEAKLQKRLREIDESEQYALQAIDNGWYPCLHSGRTTYYLLAGEVWKYGVTSKGETGRYSTEFLINSNVVYTIQFKGNYAECLKQEQIKLFNYPYLPENLARLSTERLSRPPFNRILR